MNARKLRVESLEERTLLAVVAGGLEQVAELVAPTEATTWVVNTLDDPTSWDTADDVVSLREAIDNAIDGDTIVFDESLAGGTITLNGSQLEVYCGITIDASAIDGIIIDANGQSRVFYVSGGDEMDPVELISLTITGGWAEESGGAIYNVSSTLTLSNCIVTGNTVDQYGYNFVEGGGGIFNIHGTMMLANCTISGNIVGGDHPYGGGGITNWEGNLIVTGSAVVQNSSSNYGGGIYNWGSLTVIDSVIEGNTASNGGGGINNDPSSQLAISNSVLSGNSALNWGGGIINFSGTVTLYNASIAGNTSDNGCGGGIYNDCGTLTITDSTVSKNTAEQSGGIENDGGTVTVTNSTISGNTAGAVGGIASSNSGSLTLVNSTVIGNVSKYADAGGICNTGSLTVTCSTISGNTADTMGGGIANSGELTLTNSIVSLNYADIDSNIYHSDPFFGNNNIIDVDPGFVVAPVFENGELVNLGELDLSLTAGSIAIDAGKNSDVQTETDIAGNSRIFAAWLETPTVDIGAYEYQGIIEREIPSTVVTTNLDIFDFADDLISLREAIFYAKDGDTITFDGALAGGTITLKGNQLEIYDEITIDATSIGGITIDADGKSRVFYVSGGGSLVPVKIICLSFINGCSNYHGGGIYNTGTLELKNCKVSNNVAGTSYNYNSGDILGGGIYNSDSGSLRMLNCCISWNMAPWGYGGNIANHGFASLINCTISDEQGGGEIFLDGGSISLYNSILTDNYNGSLYGQGRIFGYYTLSPAIAWTESENCIVYDRYKPLFADPEHGDYTLAENSQAINAGNNDYVTTETDLAGNPRILNGTVDLGAYEYTGPIDPLDAPTILTGTRGYYVSYGANRHQIEWSAADRAVRYEFAYSQDGGSTWTSLETNDTTAVIRGLYYGDEVSYRVRALSTRYLENSEWSATKTFIVCPMDINNDGDISGPDRSLMASAWGMEIGDEKYRFYADINGDGDISGPDRNILGINWGYESDDPNLLYPRPVAASDVVFAEFESADIDFDADAF